MLHKLRCLLATSVSNVGTEEGKCKHSLIKSLLAILSDMTCTLLGPSHTFPLQPKAPFCSLTPEESGYPNGAPHLLFMGSLCPQPPHSLFSPCRSTGTTFINSNYNTCVSQKLLLTTILKESPFYTKGYCYSFNFSTWNSACHKLPQDFRASETSFLLSCVSEGFPGSYC